MTPDPEVIVVGAGPAGSTAALLLARNGHSVLLIDREAFPRSKTCGDGITPGACRILHQLGLNYTFISDRFYPINAMHFITPNGNTIETRFRSKNDSSHFLIAPREQLDDIIYRKALEEGAIPLQAQVTNLLIKGNAVCGVTIRKNDRKQNIFCRVVLGADGATSVVARQLTQHSNRYGFIGVRAYVPDFAVIRNTVEFFWLRELLPGYGWIFPVTDNCANIGLGVPAEKLKNSYSGIRDLFNDFLSRKEIRRRIPENTRPANFAVWPLRTAGNVNIQRVCKGALLLGDAAALIDPFSGEGIRNALRSGQIAADTVNEALKENRIEYDKLHAYQERCRDDFDKIFRRSLYMRHLLAGHPGLIEWPARFANRYPRLFAGLMSRLSTDFLFSAP